MTHVTITTATQLSATQLSKIKKTIQKKYGEDVECVTKVAEDIIGGIILTINSREIDNSVKTKLEHIKDAMYAKIVESAS